MGEIVVTCDTCCRWFLFQSSVSLKIILTFLRLVCATNALERFPFSVILWYWRNRGASRFENSDILTVFLQEGTRWIKWTPTVYADNSANGSSTASAFLICCYLLLEVVRRYQKVSETSDHVVWVWHAFFVIRWAFTEHLLVKVWLALHFETLSIRWMQNLIYIASLSLNFKRIDGWRMCAIFMWLQANATRVLYGGCSLRRFAQHWLSPTWRVRFWEHCKVCDSWSWSSLHRGCWFFLWWY